MMVGGKSFIDGTIDYAYEYEPCLLVKLVML